MFRQLRRTPPRVLSFRVKAEDHKCYQVELSDEDQKVMIGPHGGGVVAGEECPEHHGRHIEPVVKMPDKAARFGLKPNTQKLRGLDKEVHPERRVRRIYHVDVLSPFWRQLGFMQTPTRRYVDTEGRTV